MNPDTLKKINSLWNKYQGLFFFVLTLSGGLIIYTPFLNFQPLLAQGDHGRDLYAFAETLRGAKPYQDYWWVYGPLMPYYYALFFKWFGVEIPSVLLGKMILNLFSGMFLYLSFSTLFVPVVGFLTTLWFWTFKIGRAHV